MTAIAMILSVTAAVMILCMLSGGLSSKAGLPVLLIFIGIGMMFGSDGLFKLEFENFEFAEQICTVAMVFIIFYGGFGAKWSEAKKVAAPSMLLSCAGTILTAAMTTLFCRFVLQMGIYQSLLVGAVLSSTDAASVFSILRSKNLNLKYNSASILEIESGSNDPWAYMLTVIMLSIVGGGGIHGGEIAAMFIKQLVFGVGIGIGIALVALAVLKNARFKMAGFDTVFLAAVAILSFSLPILIGGNGFLSCYLAGIILGNSKISNKKVIVHFFDGITGIMQIALFFLLGLLSTPSELPEVILPALAIALVMSFVIRPLAVAATLAPFKAKLNQIAVISFAGLRGATSIVFAIMVAVSDSYRQTDVFNIVFCVVLFSIGIQGTLLPWFTKKTDMLDEGDVMKTFTDYSNETQIQFIRLPVKAGHPWLNKSVRQVNLPPETLLVMIMRGDRIVIPRGSTQILENDVMVLSAIGYEGQGDDRLPLSEEQIGFGHEWAGRTIAQAIPSNVLVVLIKRGERTIIPNGNSVIKPGDILVTHTAEGELVGADVPPEDDGDENED